ncbi:hypothetical protein BUALT_Bualt02G0139400 [Buddleja alternifolia]|uniref:Uncharacterized protein n=1 Tax=Buddleja alternifolia TaxID=168488 RepID=A0AAV6Y266_9LAMI|nr:hypothetical protein BUALT_Bualt02G0139400 [Buddleja alternifolia]
MATKMLEQCEVAPSSGAVNEQLLPLVHFDMLWLPRHLLQNLIFYEFPCSKSHFLETIVPNLKKSLSLALKHFPPLAGNIIFPLINSNKPVSHYKTGDSISVTIMESISDFIHLTGNHQRDADEFHHLVPQLPPSTYSSEFIKIPVAAIHVTLFPNQGISIGFTTHHAIGDGSTLVHFLNAWASINKFNGDAHLLALGDKFSPFYDRNVVEDANGLDARRWDLMKNYRPTVSSIISLPTYKVRATFIMSEADIQKLKSYVIKSLTMADHYKVSSFAAVCAYIWTCFARSAGEVLGDDEAEYFSCPVDCRRRLNPPLPDTYFGNCLAVAIAESTHGILKGTEGFLAAVEAIVKAIDKTVNDEKGILDGSDRRLSQLTKMIGKRVVGVAGSTRLDSYGADYGWGRVKKHEVVSIDNDVSISLGKTRDESQASLEIGLSMTKVKMDAFAAAFYQGLTLT